MKHVHQTMMRTIKTYENEAYDYPVCTCWTDHSTICKSL